MTILEVIQRSSDFLGRKGVDSPRLQSELLLAHVLQIPRLKLYLDFGRKLTEAEVEVLRMLVQRRSAREPLQHILGSTSFCGLEIAVTPAVLVPRPETELLAERAWQWARQRASIGTNSVRVLDFGTGSGCVAIALAMKVPEAEVHALEISEAALGVARRNAAAHEIADRIQFHSGDGFQALPSQLEFDMVVSNPPYIPTAEIEQLEPEVREHDPRVALDGGFDGLDFYRRLAGEAPAFMPSGGCLMVEFGAGQEKALPDIFRLPDWVIDAIENDYGKVPRILIAHRAI